MNKKEWLEKGAIIEYLTAVKNVCVSNEEFETSDNLGKIILEIKNGEIPAADVASVVHGYWAKEKTDVIVSWKCSACCNCYYLDEPNAKYCPNCGAKMDGKDNDSNE